ncbi:MAG: hypothetical protein Q8L79_19580 [Methylobacter sp.]|uniref:hypothetical protein n=1 Tax=Methylobacter sp. TaxID=2051955 RepID=UPI0027314E76|nr:hypothetical protein [Methylobacter sp.]MDP1667313.1 hypothetical protein [Methylobacter sp.]
MRENDMQDEQSSPHRRHFSIEETVFILLVILSLLGIVITDFSRHDGYGYWMIMVVVFGTLAIFVSWLQAKTSDNDFGKIVKEQGQHWFHTLIVVGAASLIVKSEISASLVILLILSLATMLDGMRIGWQFTLLGFFLLTCAIIVAYVEQFVLACFGLAVLVVIGTFVWGFWLNYQSSEKEN